MLAALGVVFGDIGTSPLYAFKETLNPAHGVAFEPSAVLGLLSLIVWGLMPVVTLKYVVFVLRADYDGEGGILALQALARQAVQRMNGPSWLLAAVFWLGLVGAAMFYGDSLITPAISVLSAVEGLEVQAPALQRVVVPITLAILVVLFAVQYRGTSVMGRVFGPVMAFLSRLLQTRGVVLPIVSESLHLAAELEDGSVVVGQHHFKDLSGAVRRLFLTVHEPDRNHDGSKKPQTPCRPPLAPASAAYLRSAGAICYPMGSFYTSVLANLLPQGVGSTVAEADCPKIFIPNSGSDAELLGLSVAGQAAMILRHLREDAPEAPNERLLHHVLIDSRHGRYEGGLGEEVRKSISDMGLNIVDRHIVCENNPQYHEPELTARALLDLLPGKAAEI